MQSITADTERSVAQAKALLMQADPASGRSLYDHLQVLVRKMLDENPSDVANRPELIAALSRSLKEKAFVYGENAPIHATAAADCPAQHARLLDEAAQQQRLLNNSAPKPIVETVVERPTPLRTVTTTVVKPRTAPRFRATVRENALWRAAGFGMPEAECRILDASLSQLALDKKLEELRFFGKIFGTQGDYLVATSKRYVAPAAAGAPADSVEQPMTEVNTMPKPARKTLVVPVQPEPAYKGVNRLTFWVAPHAGAEWTALPDTTPQLITAARGVRKLFSGDLSAPVQSYPPFPGTERELLRAQLSRILSATYIAPSGAAEPYEAPEGEEEEEEVDEDEALRKQRPAKYRPLITASKAFALDDDAGGVKAFADLEQWVHAEPVILKTGRQTKVPPKPEPNEAEQAALEAERAEREAAGEPVDEEEEENAENAGDADAEKELLQPVRRDCLYTVLQIPQPPNPEEEAELEELDDDGDEEEEVEEEELDEDGNPVDKNAAEKPKEDEDVPDDDPAVKKIHPWAARLKRMHYKKHGVAVLQSLRWPGAVAYVAKTSAAKTQWGCVYFGEGLKAGATFFTPELAPPIMGEAAMLVEVADPTAANEKLVLRGEEPKLDDSEDDRPDEEEEADEEQ